MGEDKNHLLHFPNTADDFEYLELKYLKSMHEITFNENS